jgi:hypothetical protein
MIPLFRAAICETANFPDRFSCSLKKRREARENGFQRKETVRAGEREGGGGGREGESERRRGGRGQGHKVRAAVLRQQVELIDKDSIFRVDVPT